MEKNKSKIILDTLLKDMDDFSIMKNIDYPPIYLLGGSACIVSGYLSRATTDIDILDMEYDANVGRLLRLLDEYDFLDIYLTTIPLDFAKRAIKLDGYKNIYVLSREDIIVSKIGRYSPIDIEDISQLLLDSDKQLIRTLIDKVLEREDISPRVKGAFVYNSTLFKEKFNV